MLYCMFLFCRANCHFCKNQKQRQWQKLHPESSQIFFFFCLRTWFRQINKGYILRENYNEKTQTANIFSFIGSLFLSFSLMHWAFLNNRNNVSMGFKWCFNNSKWNGPIDGTEMLLAVHHFLFKLTKWEINGQSIGN